MANMEAENKKYKNMENVLNKINKDYISLPASETKRNNKILDQVMGQITTLMKEKDALFRNMYERNFYGGSYYDGIKVGAPEEYDLDYVLNLPLIIEPVLEAARDKPGFVHVRVTEYAKLLNRDEAPKFAKLDTLMDSNNYLSTSKVLQRIESTIKLAINELEKVNDKGCKIDVKLDDNEIIPIYVTTSKSYPAFTLKLKNEDGSINLDIDLVPCFQFSKGKWPNQTDGYRPNPFPKRDKFLVVPKKPHDMDDSPTLERYWRLSFQEQERELIKGHEFKSMKPTIKLLKKLRDKQKHVKIASYYIKTIFLWEVDNESTEIWQQPFSSVFMMMLRKYADMVQNRCIPYYWNKGHNLIGHLKEATVVGIGNTLRKLLDDIERNIAVDPFVVARYLIDHDQIETLRPEVDLGKKHLKQLKINQYLMSPSDVSTNEDSNSSVSSLSEDEKVKRLVLNEDFLQEAENLARDAKILQSLDSMQAKTDKMAGMISDLSTRVSNLESSNSELREKNGRLRSALRRVDAEGGSRRSPLDDPLVLFGLDNLTYNCRLPH